MTVEPNPLCERMSLRCARADRSTFEKNVRVPKLEPTDGLAGLDGPRIVILGPAPTGGRPRGIRGPAKRIRGPQSRALEPRQLADLSQTREKTEGLWTESVPDVGVVPT